MPFQRVFPVPENSTVAHRLGGRGHWLWIGGPLPKGSDGLTLGSLVIVRRRTMHEPDGFEQLIRHEQVHVAQFREVGVVGFFRRYVGAYLWWRLCGYGHYGAYRRIPFEVEARYLSSPQSQCDLPRAA